MSNMILFTADAPLAAVAGRKKLIDVSKDVVTVAQFPTMHIKGKVWTISQNNERKTLTKTDGSGELVQSISIVPLRINMHAKTFFLKKFNNEDSEGQRPDCSSMDGVSPLPDSPNPQSAKCATCQHNVWGARISDDGRKGKACSDRVRMAIADVNNLDRPMLLGVPPASIKTLKDGLKMAKSRGLEYNETVFRVSFDPQEASPKLVFTPIGALNDDAYVQSAGLYESETVLAIVGLGERTAAAPAPVTPEIDSSELDAALEARQATRKAAAVAPALPAPAPAVTLDEIEDAVEVAPAPAPAGAAAVLIAAGKKAAAAKKAAPKPVVEDDDETDGSLLGDLGALLSATDD